MGESVHEALASFDVFGMKIEITEKVLEVMLIQWVVMAVLVGLAIYLTKTLKLNPTKKQTIAEYFVGIINDFVEDTMGKEYKGFVPYIGTLVLFLLVMNFTGLIGIKPVTEEFSVTLALALVSFFVIQGFAIKRNGLGHYFKGMNAPFHVFTPLTMLNIVERVVLPLSLGLRLFGNMIAASLLLDLVYGALGSIGFFAKIGIPVFAHMYFDIFDGGIQMFIFVMLTMVNIKIIAEE